MKKVIFAAGLTAVLLITSGCDDKAATEDGPETVPVEWVIAEVQKDQATMLDLLDEKSKALDPEDEADNDLTIENYKLTEWKADDDRYFYEIVYEHPEKSRMVTERMEVIQVEDGWKRTTYSDLSNFDTFVADLQPEVLKEMYK